MEVSTLTGWDDLPGELKGEVAQRADLAMRLSLAWTCKGLYFVPATSTLPKRPRILLQVLVETCMELGYLNLLLFFKQHVSPDFPFDASLRPALKFNQKHIIDCQEILPGDRLVELQVFPAARFAASLDRLADYRWLFDKVDTKRDSFEAKWRLEALFGYLEGKQFHRMAEFSDKELWDSGQLGYSNRLLEAAFAFAPLQHFRRVADVLELQEWNVRNYFTWANPDAERILNEVVLVRFPQFEFNTHSIASLVACHSRAFVEENITKKAYIGNWGTGWMRSVLLSRCLGTGRFEMLDSPLIAPLTRELVETELPNLKFLLSDDWERFDLDGLVEELTRRGVSFSLSKLRSLIHRASPPLFRRFIDQPGNFDEYVAREALLSSKLEHRHALMDCVIDRICRGAPADWHRESFIYKFLDSHDVSFSQKKRLLARFDADQQRAILASSINTNSRRRALVLISLGVSLEAALLKPLLERGIVDRLAHLTPHVQGGEGALKAAIFASYPLKSFLHLENPFLDFNKIGIRFTDEEIVRFVGSSSKFKTLIKHVLQLLRAGYQFAPSSPLLAAFLEGHTLSVAKMELFLKGRLALTPNFFSLLVLNCDMPRDRFAEWMAKSPCGRPSAPPDWEALLSKDEWRRSKQLRRLKEKARILHRHGLILQHSTFIHVPTSED